VQKNVTYQAFGKNRKPRGLTESTGNAITKQKESTPKTTQKNKRWGATTRLTGARNAGCRTNKKTLKVLETSRYAPLKTHRMQQTKAKLKEGKKKNLRRKATRKQTLKNWGGRPTRRGEGSQKRGKKKTSRSLWCRRRRSEGRLHFSVMTGVQKEWQKSLTVTNEEWGVRLPRTNVRVIVRDQGNKRERNQKNAPHSCEKPRGEHGTRRDAQ